jgi:predicted ATPase
VLYLRSLVRPGDTLIIEEPEAHLHPAAQTDMAKTIARLVRAGVRVLVTTHSDYMLQEIGNLIREGELREKTSESASWLEQEEVGAWLFQKNGKVKEIEFDRIKGIEPMEYEDVAEALYNRWADLQYQLDKITGDEEDKV